MTEQKKENGIFVKYIAPAIITGIFALIGSYFGVEKAVKQNSQNNNGAVQEVNGNTQGDVKQQTLNAETITDVKTGDYINNSFDTSRYKLIKYEKGILTLKEKR